VITPLGGFGGFGPLALANGLTVHSAKTALAMQVTSKDLLVVIIRRLLYHCNYVAAGGGLFFVQPALLFSHNGICRAALAGAVQQVRGCRTTLDALLMQAI
jgi:hypothetical protein